MIFGDELIAKCYGGHLIGVEFNYLGALKQNVDTTRIPEACHVLLRYQLKK